jgi:hypothetical protein
MFAPDTQEGAVIFSIKRKRGKIQLRRPLGPTKPCPVIYGQTEIDYQGHRQTMLDPTENKIIQPEICSCGNTTFNDLTDYYTHQVIELP